MIGLRRNLFGISNRPSSLPSHVRVDVVQGTTCSAARWHKNGLYFQFTWCLTPPPFPHPTTKYSCSAMSAGRKKRDSERESLMKLGARNVNKEGRRRSTAWRRRPTRRKEEEGGREREEEKREEKMARRRRERRGHIYEPVCRSTTRRETTHTHSQGWTTHSSCGQASQC